MSRRAHSEHRCPTCLLHLDLCLCDRIQRLSTRHHLTLVLHFQEQKKPTNTGQLAVRCLENSSCHVVGHGLGGPLEDSPAALPPPPPPVYVPTGYRGALLAPGDDAVPIDQFMKDRSDEPIALVVPDGTWRQARRIRNRTPELAALPAVTLPADVARSRYLLRNEPIDGGMATLEAIAHAFAVLEGDDVVRDALLQLLRLQVDRILWHRGRLADHEVFGGLPAAARSGVARGAHVVKRP